jgi:hypothetical protein
MSPEQYQLTHPMMVREYLISNKKGSNWSLFYYSMSSFLIISFPMEPLSDPGCHSAI